jgi:hypothetical protein
LNQSLPLALVPQTKPRTGMPLVPNPRRCRPHATTVRSGMNPKRNTGCPDATLAAGEQLVLRLNQPVALVARVDTLVTPAAVRRFRPGQKKT